MVAHRHSDRGNYSLNSNENQAIWVDEYIHGYKDRETLALEEQEDVLSYLAQTPWFLLFIQKWQKINR